MQCVTTGGEYDTNPAFSEAEMELLLEKMIAENKAADEKMPKPKKAEVKKEAEWLLGYARKKPIKNFGGNFWGFNRNRCSVIKPKMIQALVDEGYATMNGSNEFIMVQK